MTTKEARAGSNIDGLNQQVAAFREETKTAAKRELYVVYTVGGWYNSKSPNQQAPTSYDAEPVSLAQANQIRIEKGLYPSDIEPASFIHYLD